MCLYFDPNNNDVNTLFGKKQVITCYKIVMTDDDDLGTGIRLVTPYMYEHVTSDDEGFFVQIEKLRISPGMN